MRKVRAFTLLEVIIAVSLLLLVLVMAVPSVSGVLADRRLRRSLDDFSRLVQVAHERSVAERRAYLIVWKKEGIEVRPEASLKDDDPAPVKTLMMEGTDALALSLPATLAKDPPAEWVFWPSGNCEPAVIKFTGNAGSWTAEYSPLTGAPSLRNYAAK